MAEPQAQAAGTSLADLLMGAALIALGLVLAAHLAGFGAELSGLFGAVPEESRPPTKYFNDDVVGRLLAWLGGFAGEAFRSTLAFLGAHFGASSFGGLGPMVPALPFWLIGLRLILR